MGNTVANLGAFIFLACGVVLLVAIITALVGAVTHNKTLLRKSLKIILVSGIIAMVGFGVCAMNFTLHIE